MSRQEAFRGLATSRLRDFILSRGRYFAKVLFFFVGCLLGGLFVADRRFIE